MISTTAPGFAPPNGATKSLTVGRILSLNGWLTNPIFTRTGDDFAFVAKAAMAKWGNDNLRADVCRHILSHLYTPHPGYCLCRVSPFSSALCSGGMQREGTHTTGI